MKGTPVRLAALGLLALGAVCAVLVGAADVTAVPSPQAVTVVNADDDPVPTSIQGTPSVQVSGTPTVQLSGTPTVNVGGPVTVAPARQPYQKFVGGTSTGSEECDELDVPDGKRLVLESLSVDGDGAIAPHVYIMVTAAAGGGANFVRAVEVELKPSVSNWAGVATFLLHAGAPAPGEHTYTLRVCVAPGPGSSSGAYRAFASGWLENA
jgi:hypothetical protein